MFNTNNKFYKGRISFFENRIRLIKNFEEFKNLEYEIDLLLDINLNQKMIYGSVKALEIDFVNLMNLKKLLIRKYETLQT